MESKKKKVQSNGDDHAAPPGYLDQIHELGKDEVSPEVWEKLGGKIIDEQKDDDDLPF